jgi:hypothetical protein
LDADVLARSVVGGIAVTSPGSPQRIYFSEEMGDAPNFERYLFPKICMSEPALARMNCYETAKATSSARSIEVEGRA